MNHQNRFVFLFNRETGESLFPIVETPVDTVTPHRRKDPAGTTYPQKPAPFVRQTFTEKDLNPYLSKESYDELKERLVHIIPEKMFTPQSREGTIIFPGFDGGAR